MVARSSDTRFLAGGDQTPHRDRSRRPHSRRWRELRDRPSAYHEHLAVRPGDLLHEDACPLQSCPHHRCEQRVSVEAGRHGVCAPAISSGRRQTSPSPTRRSDALVIKNRLSAPAVIDLTGHTVNFVYSGEKNYSAVWLDNPENLRIYGGDLSTSDTGGDCLTNHGGQHVTWWYFTAHDCGGTGAAFSGGQAPTEHDDFNGTIWKVGQNLAWDPHAEKGTGLHCVNLDDNNLYPFRDNRFAFYCHDIPSGAAIEYGASQRADPKPVKNTIYLLAVNLTDVAKIQTGGNGIQFWGVNGQSAEIKFIQVTNAEGHALWDGGMNRGTNLRGISVEYGRASNTNQNPLYAGQNPWSDRLGEVYRSVLPSPEVDHP